MPLLWEEEHACLCYEYDWTWSYIQRGETVGEELGVVLGRALQHAEEFKREKCGSLLKALWGWVGEVIKHEAPYGRAKEVFKKRQDVKAKKNEAMCWKSCVLEEKGTTLITGNVVPLAFL